MPSKLDVGNLISRRNAIRGAFVVSAVVEDATRMAAAEESQNSSKIGGASVDVKMFGAIGDGETDDTRAIQSAIDECFGKPEKPNSGSGAYLNKPLYFPQGIYKITEPLIFTNVRSGHIFGAGRFSTTIRNAAGTSVFRTNGFEFCRVEMLRLSAAGTNADVLDLDWTHSGGTALQSNTFADMRFDGGAVGVNIGKSDYMGSENLFLNCFVGPCGSVGIKTSNFNALQNTLVGGNIQSCPTGVWVSRGSCSIYNTGFQICNTFDIVVSNSANDAMVISGVRSESKNFAQLRNGITAHIVGCSHLNNSSGIFVDADSCPVAIESCVSWQGILRSGGSVRIANSSFGRGDWYVFSRKEGVVEVENCYVGGTPNIGAPNATFIGQKTITPVANSWRTRRQIIPIEPGRATVNVPIAPKTRIQKVTLIVDRKGMTGFVNVGDTADRCRYFCQVGLASDTVVSPVVERFYEMPDTLYVEAVNAAGISASVAVDFIVEV